jgi:hypothetical protein
MPTLPSTVVARTIKLVQRRISGVPADQGCPGLRVPTFMEPLLPGTGGYWRAWHTTWGEGALYSWLHTLSDKRRVMSWSCMDFATFRMLFSLVLRRLNLARLLSLTLPMLTGSYADSATQTEYFGSN